MTNRFWLPTAALLLSVGCATSNNTSNEKSESSSAAIRAAEEVGANRNPQAALHLELAKEQFEHARTLTKSEDQERADRLRMRAQADAELSLALARNEDEKAKARGAMDQLKTLNKSANP